MSAEAPINLDFDRELIDDLQCMPAGLTVSLLDEHVTGTPITAVEVSARKTEPDEYDKYQFLYVATVVGLERPLRSVIETAQDFSRNLEAESSGKYRVYRAGNATASGLALPFSEEGFPNSSNVLSPILNGHEWAINSTLGVLDERFDPDDIERLLYLHAFAFGSLISMVYSKLDPEEVNNFATTYMLGPIDPQERIADLEELRESSSEKTLDRFAGIDDVIKQLRGIIRLANVPTSILNEHEVEVPRAILLHGPSGVGKTAIMQAFGEELGAEIKTVSFGDDISNQYVGSWGKSIDAIFENAYATPNQRVLMVFDEIEGLITTGNVNVNHNISAVIKQQLEKIKDHPNVFVIASTNRIDAIDPDILVDKRVPVKIPIQLPRPAEREQIFIKLLGKDDADRFARMLGGGIDFGQLARETESFSPGDIVEVIADIKRGKFLAAVEAEGVLEGPTNSVPSQTELLAAIRKARKTKP